MLPMGTIMAACMFVGVINLLLSAKLHATIGKIISGVVLIAGLWNVLWYSLQHLTEFWGVAALLSGILMIIAAMIVLSPNRMPSILVKAKPVIMIALLGFALLYAVTIARL